MTDFDPVRLGNLASRPERPSEMARLARVCARLTDILQGAVNRRAPLVNGQIRPEEYTQRVLMSTAVSVDAAAMAREFDRAAREKKRKADR